MKKDKDPNIQFDEELAKALASAIKKGNFKLQGIDRAIFLAGQISVTGKKPE